jgi:ElaB/YqjD/DUF883 family membrane-anchored ribosome-binding protein
MPDTDYAKEIENLKEDLTAVRDDISRLTQSVSGDARNGLDHATAALSSAAAQSYGVLRDKERDAMKTLSRQVQDNPIQSVLAAVGIGVVIGSLIRR